MNGLSIGSLFAGIGGIELGLEHAGMRVAWHCEIEPAPSAVLAHHWPEVPNHGDITAVDWRSVEPVDVITGGFPCQDISYAGLGAGLNGKRSGLWVEMASAIGVLRPRFVLVENVAALFTRGFGTVVGDLAALGYDTAWTRLRASDVGAPHKRERVFIVASDADDERRQGWTGPCRPSGRLQPTYGGDIATDADGSRRREESGRPSGYEGADAGWRAEGDHVVVGAGSRGVSTSRQSTGDGHAITDANGAGRETRQSVGTQVEREAAAGRGEPMGSRSETIWGEYEPAIQRWERVTRPAPEPVDERGRLAVPFVEWMMGCPEGWVDPAGPRTAQLRALGNAVVPQCAALAWSTLMPALVAAQAEYAEVSA